MKKQLLALAIMILAIPCALMAQRGEAAFGVKAGYTSTNESAVAGLFFQYGLTDNIRISPEIGCVFRHRDYDSFQMDINLHFPLPLRSGSVQIYPLAGLNFGSWNLHRGHIADLGDVSTRINRLGANVGAGVQFRVSQSLKVVIESKYTFVKDFSTATITMGLGYLF